MKKQRFLQLIQTTASLMCCALLIIGNGPLISNPDDNDTSIIEIENPLSGNTGREQYTPQDDDYPFDENID